MGNLLADGTNTYSYNARGRLSYVSYGNRSNNYYHNGLGQRVAKSGWLAITDFNVVTYDEQGHLIGEYDAYGAPIQEIVYLGDTPLAVLRGTTPAPVVYPIYTDHLNTPRVITDSTNKVIWRWDSDPFGATLPNEDPDGDGIKFTYNLRFPGQYYDRETGLHYNYFRDYDPRIGRYVESDPIGLRGGVNTYAYTKGNPLRFIDPFGLAYFEKRPLQGSPWLGVASCNPIDDYLNTEISHEQLFFEDGKSPSNIGFFDDGTLKTEPNPTGYRCRSGKYNDCIMRKAVQSVPLRPYCLLGKPGSTEKFNCQDWASEVRREYQRVANDPQVKKECECQK